LEAATTKAAPDAAIVKADECACEPEQKAAPKLAKPAEAVDVVADMVQAEPEKVLTLGELKKVLSALFETFGKSLDERLGPIEASTSQIPQSKPRLKPWEPPKQKR